MQMAAAVVSSITRAITLRCKHASLKVYIYIYKLLPGQDSLTSIDIAFRYSHITAIAFGNFIQRLESLTAVELVIVIQCVMVSRLLFDDN